MPEYCADIHLLIDEHGAVVETTSPAVSRLLDARQDIEKVVSYAVQHMGWVALRQTPSALVAIAEQDRVSHLALIGLLDFVYRQSSQLALQMSYSAQSVVTLIERSSVARTLSDLIETRKPMPDFSHWAIAPDKSAFAPLLDVAVETVSTVEDDELRRRLLDTMFAKSYSIAKLDKKNRRFRSCEISESMARLDRDHAAINIGTSLDDISNPKVGTWIDKCLTEMISATQPRTEKVRLNIGHGGASNHIEYCRLFLPFMRGGDQFVLSATKVG